MLEAGILTLVICYDDNFGLRTPLYLIIVLILFYLQPKN